MVAPAVVFLVCAAFAAIMTRQYAERRRPYQLVWALSLSLGALAALAFMLFVTDARSVFFFKLYYIAGALLMAAYLGLGSVYLHLSRRVADWIARVLVLLSVVGVVAILLAPVNIAVLHGANVEAGTNAVGGLTVLFVAVLNSFGALAVIAGALYSIWRLVARQGPLRLVAANSLIALGTILASLAGTLARITANGSAFWALLAVGFIVLFAGFLLTTVHAVQVQAAPQRV